MITVNNDPRIACPNANWNGVTTNYCDGVTSDDVVAHEWGHAYTEYTSGLIYQWQSGALNEAYSDIWGETVDLSTAARTRARATSPPSAPTACARTHTRGRSSRDDQRPGVDRQVVRRRRRPPSARPFTDAGVTGDVVVGTDAADDGRPTRRRHRRLLAVHQRRRRRRQVGLSTAAPAPSQIKVDNAEAAGATGIVVGNNVADGAVGLAGATSPTSTASWSTSADGDRIKSGRPGPVNVTIEDVDDAADDRLLPLADRARSPRPSAARSATCGTPPATATRARSRTPSTTATPTTAAACTATPVCVNHAYALLVDGGTFNGADRRPASASTRRRNIFWHAQTDYLTPTSDFPDLADALEASCADLIGQPTSTS